MTSFYRVHMTSTDGDWVTLYVPLSEEGLLDPHAPRPWLLKCKWGSEIVYGELELRQGRHNRLVWSSGDSDSLTDFGRAPTRRGCICRIHDCDDENAGDWWSFSAASVERL